ncbi:hypothetical protein MRX96_002224 [Rhipicephalus microplus]
MRTNDTEAKAPAAGLSFEWRVMPWLAELSTHACRRRRKQDCRNDPAPSACAAWPKRTEAGEGDSLLENSRRGAAAAAGRLRHLAWLARGVPKCLTLLFHSRLSNQSCCY